MAKAKYTKWSDGHPLFIDELKRRSSARVQNTPEFHYVIEDMERLRHRIDDIRISLNEDTRRKEIADDKIRKETRSKERLARQTEEPRVYRLTLDTVDKPNLQLIMFPGKIASANKKVSPKVAPEAAGDADSDDDDAIASGSDDTKDPVIDPSAMKRSIFCDLVDLSRGPKTPALPVSTPVP